MVLADSHGSTYVTPHVIVNVVRDDPDDNKLLACAVSGHADYVVTEDKDLHRIGQYESVCVISKQQLLAILDGKPI